MKQSYYGERFGKLVVIENRKVVVNEKVSCKCDCGNEKRVRVRSLKCGNTKSCGCNYIRPEDLIGMRFGKLIVVKLSEKYKYGRPTWECICDCGNTRTVESQFLKSGAVTHCGCSKKIRTSVKNIEGNVFGKLTVINYVGLNKHGQAMWECLCECGNKSIVSCSSLTSGNTLSCGKHKADKGLKRRNEELLNKKFGDLIVLKVLKPDKYYSVNCICLCTICNNETIIRFSELNKGRTCCRICSMKSVWENNKIDISGNKYGLLTAIEESKDMGYPFWKFKCECGNEIICDKGNVMGGFRKSCGCLKSFGESEINRILTKNGISFIHQKCFDNCKNLKPLPFDFYIESINCCIEFDGEQHKEAVDYFGGVESFEKRKKNDRIKNKYCKNNNIYLLRIKYEDMEFIEDILVENKIIEEKDYGD
jgi:hypothetical protein